MKVSREDIILGVEKLRKPVGGQGAAPNLGEEPWALPGLLAGGGAWRAGLLRT